MKEISAREAGNAFGLMIDKLRKDEGLLLSAGLSAHLLRPPCLWINISAIYQP
jgi:hypothetical protein